MFSSWLSALHIHSPIIVFGTGKCKVVLGVTNLALRHEYEWGSGCVDARIIDLGTGWR
jgi:hypothetical protein